MRTLAALLALALLAACSPPEAPRPSVDVGEGNTFAPAESRNLAASFSAALACDPASLTWSIEEAGTLGFASPLDGVITQTGQFTAPLCGSIYVGTVMHVVASGCGKTASASIAIAEEVLQLLTHAFAVVNPGTPGACLAQDARNLSVGIGETVQFYDRLTYTCQDFFVPTPPAAWPVECLP